MPNHNVYQPPRYDRRDQEALTSYTLGTQASTWPQVCELEHLESPGIEDKDVALVDSWEADESIGISDSYHYLRDQLRAALAKYDSVVNNPRRNLQIVAKERQLTKQMQKNQAAIELLRSWRQGDEQEQRETLAYLKRALDEDRLSDRKLFP
jgi:hypothetical protein